MEAKICSNGDITASSMYTMVPILKIDFGLLMNCLLYYTEIFCDTSGHYVESEICSIGDVTVTNTDAMPAVLKLFFLILFPNCLSDHAEILCGTLVIRSCGRFRCN